MGDAKNDLRTKIWLLLDERKVTRFPKPAKGRIPNFMGAEKAALKLFELPEFKKAQVMKINPDSPQRPVRALALREGKVVVMPTPRIRNGFLMLNPREIPKQKLNEASTIRGAMKYGKRILPPRIPEIDLVVVGSVAVDLCGNRLGKGEGYSELEWGILFHFGKVAEKTPIFTTVHDLQVVKEKIPLDPWDFTVDLIITPTRIIKPKCPPRKPHGILWQYLPASKIEEIPLLQELVNSVE